MTTSHGEGMRFTSRPAPVAGSRARRGRGTGCAWRGMRADRPQPQPHGACHGDRVVRLRTAVFNRTDCRGSELHREHRKRCRYLRRRSNTFCKDAPIEISFRRDELSLRPSPHQPIADYVFACP
jgi:hypothetical protein